MYITIPYSFKHYGTVSCPNLRTHGNLILRLIVSNRSTIAQDLRLPAKGAMASAICHALLEMVWSA